MSGERTYPDWRNTSSNSSDKSERTVCNIKGNLL
jgi:hypothetical protein